MDKTNLELFKQALNEAVSNQFDKAVPERRDYLLIITAAKPYIDMGAELTFLLKYHKCEETHEEFPCYHIMLEFKNGAS